MFLNQQSSTVSSRLHDAGSGVRRPARPRLQQQAPLQAVVGRRRHQWGDLHRRRLLQLADTQVRRQRRAAQDVSATSWYD